MPDQQESREIFLSRLIEDLHGPRLPHESLPHYQAPRDQYLTGILYPQNTKSSAEEPEDGTEEPGVSEGGDLEQEDSVLQQRAWLPSSMGISFFAKSGGLDRYEFDLYINAGIYNYKTVSTEAVESGQSSESQSNPGEECSETDGNISAFEEKGTSEQHALKAHWVRKQINIGPVNLVISKGIPEYKEEIQEGMRLYVETSVEFNVARLTVCLINTNTDSGNLDFQERNERCFYQTRLAVRGANRTVIVAKKSMFDVGDEEDQLNGLLYRNVKEFATGHTCSATWRENSGIAEEISTSWIPTQKVDDVSAEGDPLIKEILTKNKFQSFSANQLGTSNRNEVISLLRSLPQAYSEWLAGQSEQAENTLSGRQREIALEQLEIATIARKRIEAGIELLANNELVFEAFQLANKAMVRQAQWQGYQLDWRPFQIGFVLLALESLAMRNEGREIMDLLWFPTGGGKTEAYLGLMAFIIFYRRLEKGSLGSSDGVAVLSRYTLRALTTDQFGRTAGLICACEIERQDYLGLADSENAIGIGLWIGASSTPNKFEDAKKAIERGVKPGPDQLKNCPECRSDLTWSINKKASRIEVHCDNSECMLGRSVRPLPVHTVDEQIYQSRPSVIIGTVDKFVQVCRFPERTNPIFNFGSNDLPPDLIIQDELHLISGPLGSIVGLMELAIEKLCTSKGVPPKIIGSTATIQRAGGQISALFNKGLSQFPPPVIEAGNSFFAITDRQSTGRQYLGISSAGKTVTYILQAIAGSLMQSVGDPLFENEDINNYDPFTTMAVYFNSLRLLGGARTLLWEDAQKSKKVYAVTRNEDEREIREVQELTSLVSQEELKSTLDNLRCRHDEENHIDILLASVMISVGVDIPRLGLMVVDGQPKTMAEYIQATSRVGRGGIPGLIITIYNNLKIRDRAHFEAFRSWHSALYRSVEAATVTPFAPRARDKGLKALVVALATRATDINEKDASLTKARRLIIEEEVVPEILKRIEAVDPSELDSTECEIDKFLEEWESRGNLKFLWNDFINPNESLFISAEAAAQRLSAGSDYFGWSAPNSARDVEPSVMVKVRDHLSPRRMTDGQ